MQLDLTVINQNRLYRALGIVLAEATRDGAISEMRAEVEVCWPIRKQPHGGIVFTQLDTTMATAVIAADEVSDCSTVSMQVQYLAPALGEVLKCHAIVEKRGGKICFVRATTTDLAGTLIATAQGSFRTFSK